MLNNLPDLNRLKVFCVVVESGGVTAAAGKLYLTKSAVSQTIKLLEQEIGESLFLNRGRKLVPTHTARLLFDEIAPFLLKLSERFADTGALTGPAGLLRITAPPIFGQKYLLPTVRKFRERFQRVRFQIQFTASIEPLQQLVKDQMDLCIVDSLDIMFGYRSHFQVEKLITDPEFVVCSRAYWRKNYGKVKSPSYEQLVHSDFISYHEKGAELCAWLHSAFDRSPKILEPVLVLDRADAVLHAVRKHLGLGLVPKSLLKGIARKDSVISIGGKRYPYSNQIVAVSLRDKKSPEILTEFIRLLIEATKKSVE